ncbi:ribosomal-protein-alanine N-acetyltransferase [Halopelagius inordinatus]|uniref:Ribosomal-protein-alanine N-acetyltransferase n=1 Tax=Halopelagius inordinatus TaxID=553467 RepID=A0A1I2T5I8_9EURY|nr:ribosomal-protein-alanine N-acetyltransferase [Halopelagius inordinatus]
MNERTGNRDESADRSVRADGSGAGDAAPGDTVVRGATRSDLLDVYRIEKRSFSQPWPYSAFETFLDEPGFLVAVRGPVVVGYVVADVMPNHGRGIGHVKDIAVRPDARGMGLGRYLLERALVAVAIEGATLVKLEVRVGNDAALSLYRDVGFEPARRISGYYSDGEDALVMVLDVDAWRA